MKRPVRSQAQDSSAAASSAPQQPVPGPNFARYEVWAALAVVAVAGYWSFADRFAEMAAIWASNDDYGHGYFVAPLAAFFLWRDRANRPALPAAPYWLGLVPVAVAGVLQWVGARYYLPEVSDWAMLVWLAGACWMLGGYAMLGWAWRSILFLIFMIPLPDAAALALQGPLQQTAAAASTWLLQCLGQPAISEGVTILLDEHTLEVERACSGLRMFLGVAALAFAQTILFRASWRRNVVTIASVAPVALVANIARLVVTGLLFQWTSGDFAHNFSHDFAGWTMIPLAVLMFLGVSSLSARLDVRQPAERVVVLGKLTGAAAVAAAALVVWHGFQGGRIAQAMLDQAAKHEQGESWSDAVKQLNRYLRLHPEDADATQRLLAAFEKTVANRRDRQRAAGLYRDAAVRFPERVEWSIRAAELLVEAGEFDDARDLCRNLLDSKPTGDVPRQASRLYALALAGNLGRARDAELPSAAEAARVALEEAVSQNPGDAEVASSLALVWRRYSQQPEEERNARADKVLDDLVRSNADSPEALLARYKYRARFIVDEGAPKPVLDAWNADLDRALELGATTPSLDRIDVLLAASQRALRDKNFDAGREFCQRAIAVHAADRRIYLAWGDLEAALGTDEARLKAVGVWEDGLEKVGGRDVDLTARLADNLVQLGDRDGAKKHLNELKSYRALAEDDGSLQWLELLISMIEAHERVLSSQPSQAAALLSQALASPRAASNTASNAAADNMRARAWRMLAEISTELGAHDQAAEALRQAAALQPDSTATAWAAGEALASVGRIAEALAAFDAVLPRMQPKPTGRQYLTYAETLLEQQRQTAPASRNWTRFEKALQSAKDADGEAGIAGMLAFDALILNGQSSQALQQLHDAVAATPTPELLQALAAAESQFGSPAEAQKAAARFEQVSTDRNAVIELRVRLLANEGKFAEASTFLGQAAAEREKTPHADAEPVFRWRWQAASLKRLAGDSQGALQDMVVLLEQPQAELGHVAQAAELAMSDGEWALCEKLETTLKQAEGEEYGVIWREIQARLLLAQTQADKADVDDARFLEAVQLQKDIVARRPAWAPAFLLLAQIATRLEDADGAIEAYQKAERLGDRSLRVAEELAYLLFRQQRNAEAELYMQRAPELLNRSTRLASDAIARLYLPRGEREVAIDLAQGWAARMPNDAASHLRLGWTLSNTANEKSANYHDVLKQAEAEFKRAIELAPEEPDNWAALFGFYKDQDNAQAALGTLRQLADELKIEPARRAAVLALLYESIGQYDLAAAHFRQAVEQSDNEPRWFEQAARFFATRDPVYAEELCRRALAISSKARRARRMLIGLLGERGTSEAFAEAFDLLPEPVAGGPRLATDRRLEAWLLTRRAQAGDVERAAELYQSLLDDRLAAAPADALGLGAALEAQGRLPPAYERYRLAVGMAPSSLAVAAAFVDFLSRHADKRAGTPDRSAYLDEANVQIERMEANANDSLPLLMLRLRIMVDVAPDAADRAKSLQQRARALARGLPAGSADTWESAISAAIDDYIRRFVFGQKVEARTAPLQNLLTQLAVTGRAAEAVRVAKAHATLVSAEVMAAALANALSLATPVDAALLAEAEPALTAALAAAPEDFELVFAVANLRFLNEKNDDALALYRRALELRADHPMCWNNLALCLLEKPGHGAEARAAIDRAIELAGIKQGGRREPGFVDTLSLVQLEVETPQAAQATLRQVLDGICLDPRSWLHLATIQARANLPDEARASLTHARQLKLDSVMLTPGERRALARLDRDFPSTAGTPTP